MEQSELFANAPGFDATLPHTVRRQVAGLNEIRCPVLILWGTKDVILIPRQGRRFERLIPGAELRYLKGWGTFRCRTTRRGSPKRSRTFALGASVQPVGAGASATRRPAPLAAAPA